MFGIEATDSGSTSIAIAVLATAGVLAAWISARRASRLDPLHALRYE